MPLRYKFFPPFLAEPALSPPKGRGSGGWSKGFFSTLLDAKGCGLGIDAAYVTRENSLSSEIH